MPKVKELPLEVLEAELETRGYDKNPTPNKPATTPPAKSYKSQAKRVADLTTYSNAANINNLDDEELATVVQEAQGFQTLVERHGQNVAEREASIAAQLAKDGHVENVHWFRCVDITQL